MRGAKDPSLANLFSSLFKTHTNNANQRKQEHNEVTGNPSQLVLISTTRYKIVSLSQRAMLTSQAFRDYFSSSLSLSSQGCRSPFKRLFLELEGNAYIPSIQRHFPLLALSHLKAAGALLKDSPCSFSLVVMQPPRTTLNCLHNHPLWDPP